MLISIGAGPEDLFENAATQGIVAVQNISRFRAPFRSAAGSDELVASIPGHRNGAGSGGGRNEAGHVSVQIMNLRQSGNGAVLVQSVRFVGGGGAVLGMGQAVAGVVVLKPLSVQSGTIACVSAANHLSGEIVAVSVAPRRIAAPRDAGAAAVGGIERVADAIHRLPALGGEHGGEVSGGGVVAVGRVRPIRLRHLRGPPRRVVGVSGHRRRPGWRDGFQLGSGTVGVIEHSAIRIGQTGRIAIGIVGRADRSGDPGFRDGLSFGGFVTFRCLVPYPVSASASY